MDNFLSCVDSLSFVGTGKSAELAVKEVIEQCGFVENDFASFAKAEGFKNKTQFFEHIEETETLPTLFKSGIFFYQPLGSQNAPDFIVCTNEDIHFVEVKASAKSNSVLFNGHLIRPNFTYIISDPIINFAVYKGSSLMSTEVRNTLKDIDDKLRAIVDEGKEQLLGLGCNTQGWYYYVRAMYQYRKIYEPGSILHKTFDGEELLQQH